MTSPLLTSPATLPSPRGPLGDAVRKRLTGEADAVTVRSAQAAVAAASDLLHDDDVQLALFLLYASAYGSLPGLDPRLEWDPELIAVRGVLETAFEQRLREIVPVPEIPAPTVDAVGRALFTLAADDDGPSLSRYLARKATPEQAREFFLQRSVYTLREADPHSWAIPRLTGRAKAALVEIQSDEYGGGRPDRVHAEIFAAAMRGADLDDTYGAYVDDVPAITLASHNMMSMFGLNRRLVGAIVGHLAAFEMTSSIPNKLYADGLRRLGYGKDVTDYFDEHVEADAVHEQIAARDLAGGLAEDRPDLLPDIMFGAAACLAVDGWVGAHMLDAWAQGESSLRERVDA
ncbi:iron-containing redox enzyme family protein [Microbacterium sp. NPDC090003]|uniref:iron-containing redox enzyme family protein n=1 Tax=Microbacterium sp. NPDC090003 TaxID=3364203 RepID=UPI00381EB79F